MKLHASRNGISITIPVGQIREPAELPEMTRPTHTFGQRFRIRCCVPRILTLARSRRQVRVEPAFTHDVTATRTSYLFSTGVYTDYNANYGAYNSSVRQGAFGNNGGANLSRLPMGRATVLQLERHGVGPGIERQPITVHGGLSAHTHAATDVSFPTAIAPSRKPTYVSMLTNGT